MLTLLRERLPEVLRAVAPLLAVVLVLQATIVEAPLLWELLAGGVLVALGMLLLFAGIDFGILPMGRYIGADLPERRSLGIIVVVAFALGFATTAAEPDVLVLSQQVEAASASLSSQSLIYLIAAGVGLFTVIAFVRIVSGFSMAWLLTLSYGTILGLSLVAPAAFVPIAYDAGSVTTGVLTAPVILAVSLGLTSVLGQRSATSDGFGLLGLASIGPIVVILLVGLVLT